MKVLRVRMAQLRSLMGQTAADASGYLLHGKWGPVVWALGHIHSIPCSPPYTPGADPLQLGHQMFLDYHAVSLFSFH